MTLPFTNWNKEAAMLARLSNGPFTIPFGSVGNPQADPSSPTTITRTSNTYCQPFVRVPLRVFDLPSKGETVLTDLQLCGSSVSRVVIHHQP